MELFDSHAHLPDRGCNDETSYRQRAHDAGVTRFVLQGSGIAQCDRVAEFASHFPDVFFAAGIHPHEASSEEAQDISFFSNYASMPNYVAVGEIGLDYYYDFAPEDAQRDLLKRQLELALRLNRPAVIHCRDKAGSEQAYDDAYELLSPFAENGGSFVLHSFAGSVADFHRFNELGAWFGVCGMVTFKKADNIRELAALYPEDRIMLETDSPYLAPVPLRGQENHPANLPYTARALAALRGRSTEYTAELTTRNALRFFRI